MAKVVMSEYVVIPTGVYPMQAMDYRQVEGNYGKQYKWNMEFTADADFPEDFLEELPKGTDVRDLTLPMWTQTTMTAKNKLGKFAAACGFDLEAGEELELDDLLQEPVAATVVVKETEDGSEVSRIVSVTRPKRAKKTAAVSAKAAKDSTPTKSIRRSAPVDADGEDPFAGE